MNRLPQTRVLDRLSALGDETRSRILALLDQRELSVGEVCQILQLPQSTVSGHLRVLLEAGWVRARAEGRIRHYRLAELDAAARSLWSVVRDALEAGEAWRSDRERARTVLARRVERSRAFFAAEAGRWDARREELFGPRADWLPLFGLLEPTWTVGDLGAGTGALAAALAPYVRRVVAVDRSPEMLGAAAARLEGFGNVELREGELEELPVRDGELDVALLSLVLHYVMEPVRALAEAHRALAPGGRLVVLDMRPHEREEYREEMGHVWKGLEPSRLEQWLEQAGFTEVRVAPVPPDPDGRGPLLLLAVARKRREDAAQDIPLAQER